MPETDLELLTRAALRAGGIATGYSGKTARRWEKSDGAGPVTEADLAVNDMLENDLRRARPGYGWLSEETEDDDDRLTREHVFIIDPIDGTRSFIEGARTWAHALAVTRHGKTTAAAIYLPLRDKLYTAALGQGAHLNGQRIQVTTRRDLAGASVLAAKSNYDAKHWRGEVPAMERFYRPSLAYRLSLVAEGRFDAMLTLRPTWEWDIAAGDLILNEAGAVTSDRRGQPLVFNNPAPKLNGVLTANPALHAAISNALAS